MRRHTAGFTLIEILAALVVLGLAAAFYLGVQRTSQRHQTLAVATQFAVRVTDAVSTEIRRGNPGLLPQQAMTLSVRELAALMPGDDEWKADLTTSSTVTISRVTSSTTLDSDAGTVPYRIELKFDPQLQLQNPDARLALGPPPTP